MKKIILFTALFMALPVLAECPSDKPAKWIDAQCYTCLEIQDKLPELKGFHSSGHIDLSALEHGDGEDIQNMERAFEMLGLIVQLSEVCPEAVETESQ